MLAARARCHRGLHVGQPGALGDPGDEVVAHTVVEQDARVRVADGVGEGLDEGVTGRAGRGEDQAGLDAELADAQRHRTGESGADRLAALGGGGLGDDDRVQGAQFAVEGDRDRPGGGRVEEGAAPAD
ncbi:hypothetical protein SHKM778_68340 [Streptomyces sp. KM77-8]|uniref:Uncharacterized protein n=1 Tax=Streptomyces haneummycinicus TaxID=3074435 RepID=A0AAT9HT40_9ACTN